MEKDGIITNALYAKFATEVRQIQEEILLKQVMSDSSYTGTINDLLKTESDYNKKLIIQEGNLVYVANEVSSQETKWLESLGIEQSSDYFTVEFDSAGGTEIGSQTIKTGTLVKKPSNPKKEGHDFLGWYYLKQSGSADNPTYTEIKFDFDTKITSNYSLYAKYSGEAIIHACGRNFAFWKSEYKTKITNISFEKKEIIIPDTAVESWDVRADNNCAAVTAYIEPDDDGTGYNLKIISPHTIYAHPNSAGYFQDFTNLQNISFDNFNTSKAISMQAMFQSCSKIESLDLSNFNTTNVNNMSYMFSAMSNLKNLNIENFDTKNVQNMKVMFMGCNNLLQLDVSNFDTSKVTSMDSMFYGCIKLDTLDVSKFDTQATTTMYRMFWACTSVEKLDVSNFDTKNVTNMQYMFYGCNKVEELDVSNFDTSKVTTMAEMFSLCNNLKNLDVSNFDTSSVSNFRWNV